MPTSCTPQVGGPQVGVHFRLPRPSYLVWTDLEVLSDAQTTTLIPTCPKCAKDGITCMRINENEQIPGPSDEGSGVVLFQSDRMFLGVLLEAVRDKSDGCYGFAFVLETIQGWGFQDYGQTLSPARLQYAVGINVMSVDQLENEGISLPCEPCERIIGLKSGDERYKLKGTRGGDSGSGVVQRARYSQTEAVIWELVGVISVGYTYCFNSDLTRIGPFPNPSIVWATAILINNVPVCGASLVSKFHAVKSAACITRHINEREHPIINIFVGGNQAVVDGQRMYNMLYPSILSDIDFLAWSSDYSTKLDDGIAIVQLKEEAWANVPLVAGLQTLCLPPHDYIRSTVSRVGVLVSCVVQN
ncbi:hypothetical protein Ddc_21926 [Ditylenchus destructor]|nr:hypothetical protein Ddc_21926 [Ditylenchus destructor]